MDNQDYLALYRLVTELAVKIMRLEQKMSQTTDAIAELNTETNDLSARVDAILAKASNLDSATATELRSVRDRLKVIASDPNNPVPVP